MLWEAVGFLNSMQKYGKRKIFFFIFCVYSGGFSGDVCLVWWFGFVLEGVFVMFWFLFSFFSPILCTEVFLVQGHANYMP